MDKLISLEDINVERANEYLSYLMYWDMLDMGMFHDADDHYSEFSEGEKEIVNNRSVNEVNISSMMGEIVNVIDDGKAKGNNKAYALADELGLVVTE